MVWEVLGAPGGGLGVHFEVLLASFFYCFFDVVFGVVLGAFWPPCGSPLEPFWGHFGLQGGPKGGQREPREVQEEPRGGHQGAQGRHFEEKWTH